MSMSHFQQNRCIFLKEKVLIATSLAMSEIFTIVTIQFTMVTMDTQRALRAVVACEMNMQDGSRDYEVTSWLRISLVLSADLILRSKQFGLPSVFILIA